MKTVYTMNRVLLLIPLEFLLVGCKTPNVKAPVTILEDYPEPGWRMCAAPTTAMPPGQVFAVTPDHVRSPVTRIPVAVETNRASLPDAAISRASSISLGLLGNWLGAGTSVGFRGAFNSKKTVMAGAKFGQVEQETIQTVDVMGPLKAAISNIVAGGELITPGAKYFVVLEAYKAREVSFYVSREDVKAANLETDIKYIAKLDANFTFSSGRIFTLKRKFDIPHRVLYLARPVTLPQTGVDNSTVVELGNLVPTELDANSLVEKESHP